MTSIIDSDECETVGGFDGSRLFEAFTLTRNAPVPSWSFDESFVATPVQRIRKALVTDPRAGER